MDDELIYLLITTAKLVVFVIVFLVFTKTNFFKKLLKGLNKNDKNK